MYYRILDFTVLMIALVLASLFGDKNTIHCWIVCIAIAASNIVAYLRGIHVHDYN